MFERDTSLNQRLNPYERYEIEVDIYALNLILSRERERQDEEKINGSFKVKTNQFMINIQSHVCLKYYWST